MCAEYRTICFKLILTQATHCQIKPIQNIQKGQRSKGDSDWIFFPWNSSCYLCMCVCVFGTIALWQGKQFQSLKWKTSFAMKRWKHIIVEVAKKLATQCEEKKHLRGKNDFFDIFCDCCHTRQHANPMRLECLLHDNRISNWNKLDVKLINKVVESFSWSHVLFGRMHDTRPLQIA